MTFMQPPFWASRDYASTLLRSRTTVVTEPSFEPVSVTEAMNRLRIDDTANTSDLQLLIVAARRQVEKDLAGACLVPTVIDQWTDQPPSGRVLPIMRWPLQSVASIKHYDQDDAESTLSSDDYLVDVVSRPGRVILNGDASWPTGLRAHHGLLIRHTCGFGSASKSVSSITRSGTTATVTTAAAHGFVSGNRITHAGADQSDYNGTFEITVTGAATYTFTVANSPATPATGVITAAKLAIPETYILAILTLVGHWNANREAVVIGETATALPLAYQALMSDAPVHLV